MRVRRPRGVLLRVQLLGRECAFRQHGREFASALASLDEREVDAIAERWLASHADDLGDADLYELSLCIAGLRDALGASADGARLFVLLEEKAW